MPRQDNYTNSTKYRVGDLYIWHIAGMHADIVYQFGCLLTTFSALLTNHYNWLWYLVTRAITDLDDRPWSPKSKLLVKRTTWHAWSNAARAKATTWFSWWQKGSLLQVTRIRFPWRINLVTETISSSMISLMISDVMTEHWAVMNSIDLLLRRCSSRPWRQNHNFRGKYFVIICARWDFKQTHRSPLYAATCVWCPGHEAQGGPEFFSG